MKDNIELRQDSPINQLVEAVEGLIMEAVDIYSNISIEDLSTNNLNRLANTILRNIDKADKVVKQVEGIPSPEITKCKIKLQKAIDRLYTELTLVKNDFAERILTLECSGRDVINYSDFCFNLSLKLVDRVSEVVLANNQLPTTTILDEEEDQKWL